MKSTKCKQILALILTLTLILTAIPLTALPAAAATGGDYKYQVISEADKTCEIADCKGSAKESGGYTVTEDTFKGVISAVNANSKISTIARYTTDAALTVKTDVPAAKAGDIITVSVDLSANSNLGALAFSLTYNPNEFEYVAGSADSGNLFSPVINDENSGEIIFVGAAVEAVKAAGTLLTAQFKVLKTNSTFGICVSEAADENDVEFAPEVNANSKGATVACKHTGGSWTVVKEATCTEDGSKKGICVDCGAEVTEAIPAKGHSFGNWVVTKAATCTEAGVETRTCTACGKTETQPIPAKGHSFSDWVVTTEPTCTENGTETRICVTCNEAETRPVSAKGHSFGDWIVTIEPTCTEDGVETRTCTVCGETETKPIPAKGHNWVVSADGTKRTCTVCGAEEILVTPGDVNGDGKVSAVDARWALQCAAKKRTLDEKQTAAADMNNDGKITAVDARQILKKAAGKA